MAISTAKTFVWTARSVWPRAKSILWNHKARLYVLYDWGFLFGEPFDRGGDIVDKSVVPARGGGN